jgi:hypothetical protein
MRLFGKKQTATAKTAGILRVPSVFTAEGVCLLRFLLENSAAGAAAYASTTVSPRIQQEHEAIE